MTKKREIHPEAARAEALKWLEVAMEDTDGLEEFWDNNKATFVELPPLASILTLAPQVLTALKTGQPLPAMSPEQREVFNAYFEDYDNTIATSELANTDEEIRDDLTDAIVCAWVALRQPLQI